MSHETTGVKEKVLTFLQEHPMGVLSTVSKDGMPWGSAIYCVADDDLKFYFVTREETQKYSNIAQNPNVAITFADPKTQREVQVSGTVSKVPAKDTIDVVFKKLSHIKPHGDKHWLPPVIKVHKGDWMILSVSPSSLQYADFKERKSNPDQEYITQVI